MKKAKVGQFTEADFRSFLKTIVINKVTHQRRIETQIYSGKRSPEIDLHPQAELIFEKL